MTKLWVHLYMIYRFLPVQTLVTVTVLTVAVILTVTVFVHVSTSNFALWLLNMKAGEYINIRYARFPLSSDSCYSESDKDSDSG